MIQCLKSKILREFRNKFRRGIPFQDEMTYIEPDSNWFEPVMAGPLTLIAAVRSPETIRNVLGVLKKLQEDKFVKFNIDYLETGLERFGKNWHYSDINTVLFALAQTLKVKSYLEIGVRRGRSMAMVASVHPEADLVGFDMWVENYAGIENPGPDFVQSELIKVGYQKRVTFINGNSREMVPRYFKQNRDAYFDLITVDGDHSVKGAKLDLKNVIPRLKVGGVLVFDDISNPYHPDLKKAWVDIVEKSKRFKTYSFDDAGYGVAFGIKQY